MPSCLQRVLGRDARAQLPVARSFQTPPAQGRRPHLAGISTTVPITSLGLLSVTVPVCCASQRPRPSLLDELAQLGVVHLHDATVA